MQRPVTFPRYFRHTARVESLRPLKRAAQRATGQRRCLIGVKAPMNGGDTMSCALVEVGHALLAHLNADAVRSKGPGSEPVTELSAGAKSADPVSCQAVWSKQAELPRYCRLTIADLPQVEVHIVESRAEPSGGGEAGVPPIAPAVANVIFAANCKRVRSLLILPEAMRQGRGV